MHIRTLLAGRSRPTKKQLKEPQQNLYVKHADDNERVPKADLAWHVKAWGYWVLDKARRELARYYPTYADFEPLDKQNPNPMNNILLTLQRNLIFKAQYIVDMFGLNIQHVVSLSLSCVVGLSFYL
jgi:hypothetical protein